MTHFRTHTVTIHLFHWFLQNWITPSSWWQRNSFHSSAREICNTVLENNAIKLQEVQRALTEDEKKARPDDLYILCIRMPHFKMRVHHYILSLKNTLKEESSFSPSIKWQISQSVYESGMNGICVGVLNFSILTDPLEVSPPTPPLPSHYWCFACCSSFN